jgi:glutamyl-tRNA synthetase
VFVLRIEDTDTERSSADMVTGILDGLRWLGLDWDEGPIVGGPYAPYFQSGRVDRHRAAAARLHETGHAYYCYCSADRLRAERELAEAGGHAWQYDRRCLRLSADERTALDAAGMPRALRFRVRAGRTTFDDAVHGRIDFDGAHIEDFVILRSDGHPTYHLSVVVDDVDMAITHVIRGDDHISNTPKHVLLFEALGAPVPHFAHVPLILGADKKRLSKRHGATSVMEYERQGYISPAVVNFLALLGWSPGDDREIMSKAELVEAFSLSSIGGGNAVFNTDKLDWMNGQYLGRVSAEALAAALGPQFIRAGIGGAPLVASAASFGRLLELLRPRAKRLTDFVDQARPLVSDEVDYTSEAVEKHLSGPDLAGHIEAFRNVVATAEPFDESNVELLLRELATARGVKAGALIHAVRVAATGRTTSPGIFDVIAFIGRDRTVARLDRLLRFLQTRP